MKKLLLILFAIIVASLNNLNGQGVNNDRKIFPHNQFTEKYQGANEEPIYFNYGSPNFDNPSYYYAPISSPPSGEYYRQAGLSPDGTKIFAQKSYVDGSYNRIEIVLMNADGTGESIISPGNSGEGDIYGYMNPFWSDDGNYIGFCEVHNTAYNKVMRYHLSTSTTIFLYEPTENDVSNPDFLGNSLTAIVFWAYGAGGSVADLFTWDGTTLTNITNTADYKEYEPVSNADGTKILYWSGETTTEPVNTTHTLNYSGETWIKDVGFTPIPDTYWSYWTDNNCDKIGVTVMSTKDLHIYDNTGVFLLDLTGSGYSGGSGQWNFFGSGIKGVNGEMLFTSNAGRTLTGRDIVMANPRALLFVDDSGSDLYPGTINAPFATISKGISEANSGATVNVAAGNFHERLNINKSLIVKGAQYGVNPTPTGARLNTAEETIIDLVGVAVANPNVLIEIPTGVTDVTIDGFTLNGSTTYNYADEATIRCWDDNMSFSNNIMGSYVAVLLKAAADNLTLNTNKITANKQGLIVQTGPCNNFMISGNKISLGSNPGGDESAIYLANNTGTSISSNIFTGFINGRAIHGSGVHSLTISGNDFLGNRDGISIFSGSSNITINGANNFTSSTRYGINIKADVINIQNNSINGSGNAGISLADHVNTTNNVVISGNTFATNNIQLEDLTAAKIDLDVVLNNNTFDRAVVVRTNPIAVPKIFSKIQDAITAATAGQIVDVKAGTYVEAISIDNYLTIQGQGETTIISSGGSHGFKIIFDGDSDTEVLTIKDMKITNSTYGVHISQCVISNVTLKNLIVDGCGSTGLQIQGTGTLPNPLDPAIVTNLIIENCKFNNSVASMGMSVDKYSSVSGLTINNSEFNGNSRGFYAQRQPNSLHGVTNIVNVLIQNTKFNNNRERALYLEKIDNAVFDNIEVSGNGYLAGSWNTGMEINLKFASYSSIEVKYSTFSNNGSGNTQNYGTGLNVKARDDGSYSSNPASLANLQIHNNTFSGNQRGIGIGEYGIVSNSITSVAINNNSITNSSDYNLVNALTSIVDATCNWWGTLDPVAIAAKVSGLVDYEPWSDASFNCGYVEVSNIQNTTTGYYFEDIQSAINAASIGNVIEVTGTHNITTITVNKGLKIAAGVGGAKFNGLAGSRAGTGFTINTTENVEFNGVTFEDFDLALDFDAFGTATVVNCKFINNVVAIDNATTTNVNAEYNYWGNPSGPLDASDDRPVGLYNPLGQGDLVSDYVDYQPWYNNADLTETAIDIALYNPSCATLEVRLKSAAAVSEVLTNMQFAVAWNTVNYSGNVVVTGSPLYGIFLVNHVTDVATGIRYAIFAADYTAATLALAANTEQTILTLGLDESGAKFDVADFVIAQDAYALAINANYYIQLYASDRTGYIYGFGDDVYVASCDLELDAKVFLQGPYDAATNLMKTDFTTIPTFPLTQPYTIEPFLYGGTESVTTVPGNAVDWVLVGLRDNVSGPDNFRVAGFLHNDGKIRGVDGELISVDNALLIPNTSYYAVVYHRNHMPVMSATAINIPNTSAYNFTDNWNKGYTMDAEHPMVTLETGVYGMIAGDHYGASWTGEGGWSYYDYPDGWLYYSGGLNDRDPILAKITGYAGNGPFINGVINNEYYKEDLTMNKQVRYSGSGNDPRLIIQNLIELKGTTNLNTFYASKVPGWAESHAKKAGQVSMSGPLDIALCDTPRELLINITANELFDDAIVSNIQFTLSWDEGNIAVERLISSYRSDFMLEPQGEPVKHNGRMYLVFATVEPVALPDPFNSGEQLTVMKLAKDDPELALTDAIAIADNNWTVDNNGGYYISVWGVNKTGRVITNTLDIDDPQGLSASMQLYPNPTSQGWVYLTLKTATSETLSLSLSDLSGRTIRKESWAVTGGLSMARTIDLTGLSQGAYLLQLTGTSVNLTKKIIIR